MKKYKHKKTGIIGTVGSDNRLKYQDCHGNVCLQVSVSMELIEDSCDWEELVEYPIGTKVYNSQTDTTYTKKEDGWYKPMEKTAYTDEKIKNATKSKFLFRTEDGVEIFEGDRFYYITKDFKINSEVAPIKKECSRCSYNDFLKYCKLLNLKFSRKEVAEEYILMNKPCLSINDVLKLNEEMGTNTCGSYLLKKNLKEIVKSRL